MESASNLTLLISLLINGMITVFFVLFLVFFLGKIIIKYFKSISVEKQNQDVDPEKLIHEKISQISNGKGKVLKYKKLD
jgi:Na+-transporting methylmalonyl-CoA/oxaloacetate decarboxylase gamma subunit|tara:strand:- start:1467 stop:1703 length:237 start_codon:yes stop_codon:yes gene_type:complete